MADSSSLAYLHTTLERIRQQHGQISITKWIHDLQLELISRHRLEPYLKTFHYQKTSIPELALLKYALFYL